MPKNTGIAIDVHVTVESLDSQLVQFPWILAYMLPMQRVYRKSKMIKRSVDQVTPAKFWTLLIKYIHEIHYKY